MRHHPSGFYDNVNYPEDCSGATFFSEAGGTPADRRAFVHKRLFAATKGFLTGGPTGAAAGFLSATGQPRTLTQPTTVLTIPGFTRATSCPPGLRLNPLTGQCEATSTTGPTSTFAPRGPRIPTPGIKGRIQRLLPGGETGFEDAVVGARDFGEAVMGRYGAGLVPATRVTETAVCPRGAVLGNDGICYNRTQIKNGDRMWPRGRRPLLTGGEMRAISIATRAAGKVKRNNKRLMALGLLPKPRAGARAHQRAPARMVTIESGPGSVVT